MEKKYALFMIYMSSYGYVDDFFEGCEKFKVMGFYKTSNVLAATLLLILTAISLLIFATFT